jgi:hypothetical protein
VVSGRVVAFEFFCMTCEGTDAMGVVQREDDWGIISCGGVGVSSGFRVVGVSDSFGATSVLIAPVAVGVSVSLGATGMLDARCDDMRSITSLFRVLITFTSEALSTDRISADGSGSGRRI